MLRSFVLNGPLNRSLQFVGQGSAKIPAPMRFAFALHQFSSATGSKPSRVNKVNRSVRSNILSRLSNLHGNKVSYTEILEDLKILKDLELVRIDRNFD